MGRKGGAHEQWGVAVHGQATTARDRDRVPFGEM